MVVPVTDIPQVAVASLHWGAGAVREGILEKVSFVLSVNLDGQPGGSEAVHLVQRMGVEMSHLLGKAASEVHLPLLRHPVVKHTPRIAVGPQASKPGACQPHLYDFATRLLISPFPGALPHPDFL